MGQLIQSPSPMENKRPTLRILKRGLLLLGIVLLLLAGLVFYNTFTFESQQIVVSPIEKIPISDAPAERLAAAIRLVTISKEEGGQIDSAAFYSFDTLLQRSFPLADSLLNHQRINDFAHLYEWKGQDSKLPPILLLAHYDVVPVDEKDLPEWEQDPFGGKTVDGVLWGRGTLDDKTSTMGILEAVEYLLAQGFQPARSLVLAFGHDEEVGGKLGAQAIAAELKSRGVSCLMALDEGFFITQGLVPGLDKDMAFIGIAEKGYLSLRLDLQVEGGHSAIPNAETAIAVLAKAIARIQDHPMPPRFSPPLDGFLKNAGPEMAFAQKMAFANTWLFEPMILNTYVQKTSGNALVRTTITPTMIQSGTKDNVVPQFASATLNCRLLPGDDAESVMAHLREVMQDDRISIQQLPAYKPASAISSDQSAAYRTLSKTIKEVFGDVHTSPNLVVGATDGYYYQDVAENVYRFLPQYLGEENIHAIHGINECLPVSEYKDAIRFYIRLVENLCGKELRADENMG